MTSVQFSLKAYRVGAGEVAAALDRHNTSAIGAAASRIEVAEYPTSDERPFELDMPRRIAFGVAFPSVAAMVKEAANGIPRAVETGLVVLGVLDPEGAASLALRGAPLEAWPRLRMCIAQALSHSTTEAAFRTLLILP